MGNARLRFLDVGLEKLRLSFFSSFRIDIQICSIFEFFIGKWLGVRLKYFEKMINLGYGIGGSAK